ncbi:MAG: phosphoribosyltransferase family protein [Burkholderiaceae bacterium]
MTTKISTTDFLAVIGATIASRLLPSSCALCGQQRAGVICASCQDRYTSQTITRCERCAMTLKGSSSICGRCIANPPSFDATFCATDYAPPIDVLVQSLKFGARLPLAAAFAQRMLNVVPRTTVTDAAMMIAVPLSSNRLVQRGFNQAHEIAKPLARAWRLPLASVLCVRVRDTEPQSSLPLSKRRGNMRGAFTLMRRDAVEGKHVIVVDDVMTTGETLNAIAALLKRFGASRVTNLVFARTPAR